jgi:lysophospholipid acyltransferase (LPLAT)-like uncharacterized protein
VTDQVTSQVIGSARVPKILTRRLTSTPWVQKTIGIAAAEYLRFVWNTTRFALEPQDIYQTVVKELPVIVAMWHGQHFLVPFIKQDSDNFRAKVLISRHRDGEINAIAAERLGVGTIRGSGDHGSEFNRKGGVSAFKEMLSALQTGYNVALTADIPRVTRVCGLGIVKLASHSGRHILPIAVATQRRIDLNSWDRSAINLPFGRGARVVGEAIRVPKDANDVQLENARLSVEASLNAATRRAYEIVDGNHRGGSAGG